MARLLGEGDQLCRSVVASPYLLCGRGSPRDGRCPVLWTRATSQHGSCHVAALGLGEVKQRVL